MSRLDHSRVSVALDGFLTLVQVSGSGPLLLNVGRIVFTADVVGINEHGLPVTGGPTVILFESGVDDGTILNACQAPAL